MIRYYVYGLPKRIKVFFGALTLIIVIIAVLGVTTTQEISLREKLIVLVIVIAAVSLFYFILKRRNQQAEAYRNAIENLKQEIEETEAGVKFKKPMLATRGTITILFNPMRSTGFRTAARKFDFKAETEPVDVKELKIDEPQAFTLYKHPLTVVIKATAWKLIDPEYGQHEIYIVLLPRMIYEDKTERFELTSGIRTIEVLTRFTDHKLEIIAEGSQNDEVQLEVNFGEELIRETMTLKGGEKTTIPLLPALSENAILVIHGKSVKMIDVNYMQLAADIAKDLNLEQVNVSEYLTSTEPITIKAKYKKTSKTVTINQPIKTR